MMVETTNIDSKHRLRFDAVATDEFGEFSVPTASLLTLEPPCPVEHTNADLAPLLDSGRVSARGAR